MQNQKPTATQQVQHLTATLNAAFVRKEDAKAVIEAADREIIAIRNVLAGVGIGQELQKETAQAAPVATPEPTKE